MTHNSFSVPLLRSTITCKNRLGENFAEKKKSDFKQYVCLQSEKEKGRREKPFSAKKNRSLFAFQFSLNVFVEFNQKNICYYKGLNI